MRIARSGRFVFLAQWVLPFLLLLFLVVGRGLVGSPLGWMAVIGIWVGLPVLIALYLPPLLTVFDRDVRATKATRTAYSIATGVLWIALVVTALAVVDGGDDGTSGSALTVWTGGGLSAGASYALMTVAGLVATAALVISFVLAIVGIVWARRPQPATPVETAAEA